jgi:hypothetical protein
VVRSAEDKVRRKVTRRFGGIFVIPFISALAMLLAPSAWADTYTDQVVGKFDAQTHVVADAAARPPLQNPDRLNEQILTSRWAWSPAPPLWVAAVAPGQTGVTTPDAIHGLIAGRDPGFSGVILVIDSKGYHVRAYNVPRAVADSVNPFLEQSARDHRNDPYGATSDFVGKLAGVSVASGGPATTSPVGNAKHTSWTWLWVTLIIVGLALVIWFAVSRNRKRRKDTEAREQVKEQLIAAESEVADLDSAVITNADTDVSAESLKANSGLFEARKAYQAGDYTAARAHLRAVQSTVDKANRKLNPGAIPNVSAVTSVPGEDRKQATVQTKNPATGQNVTINNNNYSTTPQPGYGNYYPGGLYNGMFFYPGYYPYAFWGPGWGWGLADVLLVDAMLDDHWGGSYDRGFEDGRDSAFANQGFDGGQSAGYDSQQADAGFDGSYSGGGDTGFGGNDSGGGYDSGGGVDFGGSDFGGGGFDSGGSDFGGGFDSGGGNDSF